MSQAYAKCKYPECNGNASDIRDGGLCRRHAEILRFFMWMMENVKLKDPKKTPSGLVLP